MCECGHFSKIYDVPEGKKHLSMRLHTFLFIPRKCRPSIQCPLSSHTADITVFNHEGQPVSFILVLLAYIWNFEVGKVSGLGQIAFKIVVHTQEKIFWESFMCVVKPGTLKLLKCNFRCKVINITLLCFNVWKDLTFILIVC